MTTTYIRLCFSKSGFVVSSHAVLPGSPALLCVNCMGLHGGNKSFARAAGKMSDIWRSMEGGLAARAFRVILRIAVCDSDSLMVCSCMTYSTSVS